MAPNCHGNQWSGYGERGLNETLARRARDMIWNISLLLREWGCCPKNEIQTVGPVQRGGLLIWSDGEGGHQATT